MSVPQIRLKVEGFRAISKADIIIDGITVVAGENGSGKSTLSKLLYYVFKTACNYESLVEKELRNKLSGIIQFLEIAISELSASDENNLRNNLRNDLQYVQRSGHTIDEKQMQRWDALIDRISLSYLSLIDSAEKRKAYKARSGRLEYIVNDLLKRENKLDESSPIIFKSICQLLKSHYREAIGKITSRPTSLFIQSLENVFSDGNLPEQFDVLEFDKIIISTNNDHLSIPYIIQNTIYTDTPMSIGLNNSNNEYWEDLNVLLRLNGKSDNNNLSQAISSKIIAGEVVYEESVSPSVNAFLYKRADGTIFNLLECATGIRSFAILQLLLKNGSLNDKTLLIIDEPEVHLHPQWIVEYARIIVMLNKQIGVKFFIASHDPDFVSAIRYISEKEGNLEKVHFYLAEKEDRGYVYDYKHLDKDIDPIFKSFNKAIDRINEYGI